jgi:hypothetical protein
MKSKIPPPFKRDPLVGDSSAKPSATAQQLEAAADTTSPTAPSAQAPAMTGESLLYRLRYFENLATQYEAYIATLQGAVKRQGGAPPTAYFAPLKAHGFSYIPNVSG